MTPKARQVKINTINEDLGIIQGWLTSAFSRIEDITTRFKEERKDIFHEIRRQTKRSPMTRLILKCRLRQHSVLSVPSADWKTVMAKGKSVDNAQATMNGRGSRGFLPTETVAKRSRGQMSIFSNTIPKNRKHGWRVDDLMRYAHPAEYQLIEKTEAELEPIRKRIAGWTATGKKLSLSRHRHLKMLDQPDHTSVPRSPRKSKTAPSWAQTKNQLPMEFQAEQPRHKADPPQFRKPV